MNSPRLWKVKLKYFYIIISIENVLIFKKKTDRHTDNIIFSYVNNLQDFKL